ncbi:CHAP domain-containing protein [Ligilactobacillus pabuli]|uniref:CHAP domain-containing protein n=1 Tax=Ligilactobacillus pabuli TaxID=2886039 RepID=A0ABQ5JHV9_9LACO|nr:CHAP domain-containing protein [Ligilactobacillus pabuli]GKS80650.1 CHAP domain-containing protein [Ligilactobacillus pabuli]
MKKNLLSQCAIVLATVTTMSVVAPSVLADTTSDLNDVNSKISQVEEKISASQKKIDAATKVQMEKSQKINDLKSDIAKRDAQLKKQAQSAQLNSSNSMLKFVSDSDSFSDAVGRSVTVARIVGANNQAMQQQKDDKAQVETEQAALTKSVKAQKDEKLSLLRNQAELGAEKAELTAKKNSEDATAKANAEAARKAANDAKKTKDTEKAGRLVADANRAANADQDQANRDKQNDLTGHNGRDNGSAQKTQVKVEQVQLGGTSHGKGGGPNGYPAGQCTYYVKMVAPWVGGYWGNGQEWAGSAAAAGFRVDHTPAVGSVAVYAGGSSVGGWIAAPGYGHVAYVVGVNGSSVTIQQGGTGFSNPMGPNTQTLSAGAAMAYIHP